MCAAVTCKRCSRPSWKGCGMHVEQVLGHVAPADRCQCALARRLLNVTAQHCVRGEAGPIATSELPDVLNSADEQTDGQSCQGKRE